MVHNTKRTLAAVLASVAALGMLASCGSGTGISDDSKTLTIFNSKMEIQSQFEEMAKKYGEEKGVNVEVSYSSDTVAAHLATRYASNAPYVLSMVDAKDIYSLGPDHALDLSNEKWVGDTDQAISVDGKVMGFPVSVEARGLIYNADAIEKVTGKKFDPSQYKTLDEFKKLIADLKADGMQSPVGVLKEDWSLAGHYLPQIYEEQPNVNEFVKGLHDGTVKISSNDKFNSLMDTFDVLKANNYAKDAPTSAEREVTSQKLAQGDIAFLFGGNWDWSVINQYEPNKNLGMMPVPQNTDDGTNEKLVGGGSKFFFIDSSDKVTDEQRQMAKDFLNWLVSDKEGQDFIVNTCSMVSPFKSNTLAPADPLGKSVKSYADKGALIPNFNYLPDDHYSKLGAEYQKYLANQIDRPALADAIDSYWQSTKISADIK
ncbi:ABC transporter substrate-binding protein [Galliscardovia ingluviei]|uniref:ABC transporter substrate-binding protein n=1 Tax=Galliscardovia ingluviei TaxID=1769422 RepID=A0A8J3EYA6_9BIFI|nr:ABC transporter substrate-binding protein [Galliscardovia ingluviei]GGI14017.1 ABC transporter substrate-binding protein [Galliscardovia ingluviei]